MHSKGKNSFIELYRFIAVLIIMGHHSAVTGIGLEYPFLDGWVYTEFFMILTGFLTCHHFCKKSDRAGTVYECGKDTPESIGKAAVDYTIVKLKPIMPYYLVITILAWTTRNVLSALNGGGIKEFINGFLGDFVFDLFMISETYTHPLTAPLWYIAALALVFPIFALMMQIKDRYLLLIISMVSSLLYYGWIGVSGVRDFPFDYLRLMAGMMLGAAVYLVITLFGNIADRLSALPVNVLLLIFSVFPIVSCALNKNMYRLDVLMMVLIIVFAFSEKSFSADQNVKAFDFLGKISMPLFVVHWYIGTLVEIFGQFISLPAFVKIILYYAGSIVAALIGMYITEKRISPASQQERWGVLESEEDITCH